MRTDIKDIEQAVCDLMEGVYVNGVMVDYTTQIIESNPPREADDVALYMGDTERSWDIVGQCWRDAAPDVWLTFSIIADVPGVGTIAVYEHDGNDDYGIPIDYIELDTRGAADRAAALMLESEQLYTGLRGATLDYIKRVMCDGKAA